MKRFLIPFLALALCPPAQAHPNKDLWDRYEAQVNSIDARVESAAVKAWMTSDPVHIAVKGRRRRFRDCMNKNRRADFVQAVLACQIEQEVN